MPANTQSRYPLPSGAYSDLETLLTSRFAARDLSLRQRKKALSQLAGPNKTRFRGRGIEFEEVRTYQPGDDIRTIDWRVTARSGGAYTKMFREERERPLLLFIDLRQPMFFGSHQCFKSVTAAYVGALLAWTGLNDGDRIGALLITNQSTHEVRPRRSKTNVLAVLRQILVHQQQLHRDSGIGLDSGVSFANALGDLRRITHPGSAIYMISDFAGFQHGSVRKHLFQLSRHNEITALRVHDPLESELPAAGIYTISNGQQQQRIDTAATSLRHQFQQRAENRRQSLQQTFNKVGIPVLDISTDDSPVMVLRRYLGNGKK